MAPQTETATLEAGRYLTTREVAERLQVTDDTIRNYCRAGQLEHIRPGGRSIRISPEALERFETAQRAAAEARVKADADSALEEAVVAGRLPAEPSDETLARIAAILRQHRREQARRTPVR